MRGGYDKLCGVVRTLTGKMEEGIAYVFTSKDQKLVKIIRHEHNVHDLKSLSSFKHREQCRLCIWSLHFFPATIKAYT